MKDLYPSVKYSVEANSNKGTSDKTDEASMQHKQWVGLTDIGNDSKINTQLLSEFHRLAEEYERLIAPLKDVVRVTQGADYNIAHPLARKNMPTDAYHLGKSMSEIKKS